MVSDAECKSKWEKTFSEKEMICAGFEEGKPNTCNGDSGGPLVCHEDGHLVITGATSFGNKCVGPYPKVFARVTNYLGWIRCHMDLDLPYADWIKKKKYQPCSWIGNKNRCSDWLNIPVFDYDGGDCCDPDVKCNNDNACICKQP